ncbi:TPA: transposase zinc-binding domain-containing protein [Legionella pneumophila]
MSNTPHTQNGLLARTSMEYARHRPEQTLLYQVIEEYYPAFLSHLAELEKSVPQYVQDEFESYLKCERLEHGFLRVQCESCHVEQLVAFSCKRRGFCPSCGAKRMVESAALLVDEVLPEKPIGQWVLSVPYPLRWLFASEPEMMSKALLIVTRAISSYLIKKTGFTHKTAKTGAVTLIQRFGSALNLNIHFHMLFLDGVYGVDLGGAIGAFHGIKPPSSKEMSLLLGKISERIARLVEQAGYLERDEGDGLKLEGFEDEIMNHFQGSSITYKIAVDSQKGRKVLTIKTLPCKGSKMSWAMRLKRVFNIDITVCRHCQGRVRIIACIEEQVVIDQILAHMNQQQQSQILVQVSSCIRASPIEQSSQMTMNY